MTSSQHQGQRKIMKVVVVVMMLLLSDAVAKVLHPSRVEEDASGAVSAVLEATSQPSCSLILLTEGSTLHSTSLKAVSSERFSPRGVTVTEVTADGQDANVTLALLSNLVGQARRVRLGSWCVRVVVVSHDPAFLAAFAESSVKGRLLVWATRLLVVTRLTLPQLHTLLPSHWTFSMMNTIFLNLEDKLSSPRYRLYTYLPYSPDGAQVVRVAFWSRGRGIVLLTGLQLFPQKFTNFYGSNINVTARPWPPYWDEVLDTAPDGTKVKKYSGCDYLALKTISETLNFTINVVPTTSWAETVKKVEERKAFITAIYHVILTGRWKRYDFTYIFEFNQQSLTLAKPALKPRWQSLYYPLSNQVWAAVMSTLLLMPIFFCMISNIGKHPEKDAELALGAVVLEVMGVIVGQNLPVRLHILNSSRLLLSFWLVFAFVIGTVYRGNLIAALTLPKYPSRPETVEQVVAAVDKVTISSNGDEWIKFFAASDSEVYKKLGELMVTGVSIIDGLQMATEKSTAQLNGRRYMANMIAKHFTEADGSTQLYLSREPIFPGPSGWPIPHDAPYKIELDRCLMAIIEAGQYEKWSEDVLSQTRRESQRRQREYLARQQQQQQQGKGTESGSSIKALTLTHMQGPLMLLMLSLPLAGIAFTLEFFIKSQKNPRKRKSI